MSLLPPSPPAIHWTKPVPHNAVWGFAVITNDPCLQYYVVVFHNSNSAFSFCRTNQVSQQGSMDARSTNQVFIMADGTNWITVTKHYANGVVLPYLVTNFVSFTERNFYCQSNVQFSFDLTNWTDAPANQIYVRNKP